MLSQLPLRQPGFSGCDFQFTTLRPQNPSCCPAPLGLGALCLGSRENGPGSAAACSCCDKECGAQCTKYHPPVDEDGSALILDIWSRQWHLATGGKATPQASVSWSVMLRIPRSATTTILASSGSSGIYFEPRDSNGRAPHARFGVIWLASHTLAETLCKRSLVEGVIGVARLGKKFGLRFNSSQLHKPHNTLKPGGHFSQLAVTKVFTMYPAHPTFAGNSGHNYGGFTT